MRRWIVGSLGLLILLGGLSAGNSAGLVVVEDSSWWPGPIPPRPIPPPWPSPPVRPHRFAPLEAVSLKAQVRIQDQVATTTLEQEFHNPNASRIEGSFIFPVPKGAHLDKFKMEIDGRAVAAELLAADKAREIYADIVRKLRDPALLEYADRDLFRVRIFPMEPHSTRRVTLAYTQLLKSDNGMLGYTLPMSAARYSATPLKHLSVVIDVESRLPLRTIYSPTHAVGVKREGANRARVAYEAADVANETDLALYFAAEKDELGFSLLCHRTEGEDGYFLLLASPGADTSAKQVLPKDVVFVLDTSGSMAGRKLEQAKKALQFCIANLNASDRFEILRFSTEVEQLFGRLAEVRPSNVAKAEQFITVLKPIGGTAIDDALRQALAMRTAGSNSRPTVVIFLTDGQPTIGTTDENQILQHVEQANREHTRIFCFGIGVDVNTHLLDRITETTRAFSQYVLPDEDLELKVSSFFTKIREPLLANPTLRVTGEVRWSKSYPAALPDLFRGEQLVVVGRYAGQGPAAVVLDGATEAGPRKIAYDAVFPAEARSYEFIPRLWATRRVGYLLDEIRLHGESGELRDEVVELARKYSLVTPYTAYLIVEDETRRGVPVPMQSLPRFGQDDAARKAAGTAWGDFKEQRGGVSALAGSRMGLAMRQAEAPTVAAAGAGREIQQLFGGSSANSDTSAGRLVQYAQQVQFVGGKSFFWNGSTWMDAELQRHPQATTVRIQFGSPEYFQLASGKAELLPWLALGQSVKFFYRDQAFEIQE